MITAEVEPELIVNDAQFGQLEAALPLYAPDLAVTWEEFINPKKWMLVPDPECVGYKAEFVLLRADDRTVKLNIWFAPDLRDGESPKPHSHPCDFSAYVLAGGYSEERYELGSADSLRINHQAGEMNHIPLTTYHEVTEVDAPGETLSLMVCGPGVQGDWGYIDLHTGQKLPQIKDPDFMARAKQLNPRKFAS